MTTDKNWVHEDNVPAYRKEALLLQTNHRRWEKGKKQVFIPHPTIKYPPTWLVHYN